jgi:hypothetical protein
VLLASNVPIRFRQDLVSATPTFRTAVNSGLLRFDSDHAECGVGFDGYGDRVTLSSFVPHISTIVSSIETKLQGLSSSLHSTERG